MPRNIHEGRFRARATPAHFVTLPTEIPIPADKRNPVPLASELIADPDQTDIRWYACTTAPQCERRAVESLRREADALVEERGEHPLLAYAPCLTEWRERKRGTLKLPRQEVQTPKLRSYVFVGARYGLTNVHLGVMSERDNERRNRHGLLSVLGSRFGDSICLGPTDVAFLARQANEEREAGKIRVIEGEYAPGDSIDIGEGPFATYRASVTAVDDIRGRLLAEVEIFGRATPIELDFNDVRKAA